MRWSVTARVAAAAFDMDDSGGEMRRPGRRRNGARGRGFYRGGGGGDVEEGARKEESGRTPTAALPCGSRSPAGDRGWARRWAGPWLGLGAGPAQFG